MGLIIDTLQGCSPTEQQNHLSEVITSCRNFTLNSNTNYTSHHTTYTSTTPHSTWKISLTEVQRSSGKTYILKKLGQVWATEDNYSLSIRVLDGQSEATLYIKCDRQDCFLKWVNAIRKAKRPDWAMENNCMICNENFNLLAKRHHCRMCGVVSR